MLTLNDVDVNFFIRINEIGIEHCAAWLAHRSVGTPMEPHIIQHMPPAKYEPNIMDNIKQIWK